jgi:hypothetical protein
MTPAGPPAASDAVPAPQFESALSAVRDVEGWLSDGQARRLWDCARRLAAGASVVEIGSFRGRSAIVLALAAPPGTVVHAIDPHAGSDRGPQEIAPDAHAGSLDEAAFRANLAAAGVEQVVRHVRLPSSAALDAVEGQIDLLYVDGAHRYGPAREDIDRWGARVAPGGSMLIHDGFASIGVTLAVLRLLVAGRGFRYAGRTRSLLEYTRVEMSATERLGNAARQLAELGWFARNVLIKVAIVARARPVLRVLRHPPGQWPY